MNGPLVDSVKVADLRWTCELLSRISERQWQDAFRAGGYTPAQSARYVQTIQEKISEARELAMAAQPGLAAH